MLAKMRIGPKGQVVIPKMFRDDIGLKPGEEVIVDYTGKNIVIRKSSSDIVKIAEDIAKSGVKSKVSAGSLKRLDYADIEEKYARLSRQ